jgi:RNA polymerase sigma factor for flagellar operon FliA
MTCLKETALLISNWETTVNAVTRISEETASLREEMLLQHMPQVRLVARSIWDRVRFAVELDDLVGYGMIGLANAVDRFDPTRGILLKTYAEHRIRGAILDGLRRMDWLPRSARQRERQQRPPAAPAAAATKPYCMETVFAGGNLSDLEQLIDSRRPRYSSATGDNTPESVCERQERFDRLAEALAALPPRHKRVIQFYYGRELSMKQIGVALRVHESRVSQLHAAAIQRLRRHLQADPARAA